MSAIGTKRTYRVALHMSAMGVKRTRLHCTCPLLTQSGHASAKFVVTHKMAFPMSVVVGCDLSAENTHETT
jgi:hypothetical protein